MPLRAARRLASAHAALAARGGRHEPGAILSASLAVASHARSRLAPRSVAADRCRRAGGAGAGAAEPATDTATQVRATLAARSRRTRRRWRAPTPPSSASGDRGRGRTLDRDARAGAPGLGRPDRRRRPGADDRLPDPRGRPGRPASPATADACRPASSPTTWPPASAWCRRWRRSALAPAPLGVSAAVATDEPLLFASGGDDARPEPRAHGVAPAVLGLLGVPHRRRALHRAGAHRPQRRRPLQRRRRAGRRRLADGRQRRAAAAARRCAATCSCRSTC